MVFFSLARLAVENWNKCVCVWSHWNALIMCDFFAFKHETSSVDLCWILFIGIPFSLNWQPATATGKSDKHQTIQPFCRTAAGILERSLFLLLMNSISFDLLCFAISIAHCKSWRKTETNSSLNEIEFGNISVRSSKNVSIKNEFDPMMKWECVWKIGIY